MHRGSTLSWIATGLLIATAPFVARATLEDAGFVGDGSADAAVIEDAASSDAPEQEDAATADRDATTPTADVEAPGPRLPNGEPPPPRDLTGDVGGCGCRAAPREASLAPLVAPGLALLVARRRRSRAQK